MGGDKAPEEIIAGAMLAAPSLKGTLFIVGDKSRMAPFLPAQLPRNVVIRHASQVVEMDEKPLDAYKKKKDSSLIVAAKLVKEGEAEAMVSAGNTGAATATSLLIWRQIEGIHRPAIASILPGRFGGSVVLDTGASPDIDPEQLVEFAILGRAYAEKVMGRTNPTVHLLNIGEEEGKGNAFVKQAYTLLSKHPWFAGNIEGKGIYNERCDVVVCDAFVGNVMLKTSEGLGEWIVDTLREGIPKNPMMRSMYWPVKRVTAPLRKHLDYAEVGGSPLLGLNGLCTICHGRSNAKAIKNALLVTERALENRLLDTIRTAVSRELGGVA